MTGIGSAGGGWQVRDYDEREDRWDGAAWHFGKARSVDEDDAEPWRGKR